MNTKHYTSFLFVLGCVFCLTSMKNLAESYGNDIKLATLDLNRQAVNLTGNKIDEFPLAERGFLWDSDDSTTKKWRPQGITGLYEGAKEYIFVSWYGRKEEGYIERGSRISIIELSSLKYRHVLLVDKDMNTYPDMHAGGISVLNGKLHVADSRTGYNVIRVYNFNKIKNLPDAEAKYDYTYILIEEYNYKVPITPSYMSYDKDQKKMLIGTFAEDPSSSNPNLMAWYKAPKNKQEAIVFNTSIDKIPVYRLPNEYKKIQGMAASKAINGKTILWLSTSFGADNRSNFYKMYIELNGKTPKNPEIITVNSSESKKYPPGLEDTYLSQNDEVWLLTEFAYNEGRYKQIDGGIIEPTRRANFCIKKTKILPK